LAGYQPEWQEPAQVLYRDLTIKTTPPNSEGERWRGPAAVGVLRPGTIEGLTTHLTAVDDQGNVATSRSRW